MIATERRAFRAPPWAEWKRPPQIIHSNSKRGRWVVSEPGKEAVFFQRKPEARDYLEERKAAHEQRICMVPGFLADDVLRGDCIS